MPRYLPISDDTVLNIKGGEKFVVVKKDGLLPDGRLLPKGANQTMEEWNAYVNDRVAEVCADTTQTAAKLRASLLTLFATPDALKDNATGRHKYQAKVAEIIKYKVRELEVAQSARSAARYEEILTRLVLRLESNDASRVHRLMEDLVVGPNDVGTTNFQDIVYEHTFVVRHDWLAVLGDTNPELDEWELPFDYCLFEYRVSGHNAIVSVSNSTPKKFRHFIEVERGVWYNPDYELPVTKFLAQQVAAACVVLEAEVATKEVVRQPTALLAKRAKANKPPLLDYYILDLSRKRPRISNREDTSGEPSHHKRLHFCRGHWRQLPGRRVRIPWCLKGNAELGFVDKLYRL